MNFLELENLNWHDGKSNKVSIEEIVEFVDRKKQDCEIHIGCDSHFIKENCIFALVIALYYPGKGGNYFFARLNQDRSDLRNIKIRLLKEVEMSVYLANYFSSRNKTSDISIHLDINPDILHKSSCVFTPATSWVKSQGYKCLVKPDSWASSCLADIYAK
jgi:predicted RNase H-related nuclease YkuK (DUF458 family)